MGFVQFTDPRGLGAVALAACGIGMVFSTHTCLLIYSYAYNLSLYVSMWAVFGMMLSTFHFMEFITTAMYKPKDVSFDSFLLNHSKAYHLAWVAAIVEFWLEVYLAPWLKSNTTLFLISIALVSTSQSVRSGAMIQCGSNFAHRVQSKKQEGHELVTHGLYSWSRHPSYCGWFWWSVSSQLLLANPVCLVAYFAASWMFFKARIPNEEEHLVRFFPDQYPDYRKNTGTGIPFIP